MPDFKNTVGGRFLTMLEAQAPANFAMVMSTGIVSVALHLLDYPIGARLLFWLNAALCVGLAILYIIRLFVFPKRFIQDFRSHGAGPALDRVDLSVEPGHIVGLLGPNGSGKSTLIKLANGLLTPDAGEILIDGKAPCRETKKIVSYLPERTYFADWMTALQLLAFFGDFYDDFDRDAAVQMMQRLGIQPKQQIKQMSKGTREKVQLILVMSRKAKLYLLDEPIGGVDPATRDFILNTIISNYNPEAAVIISTHLIADVEHILDDVAFLSRGHLLLQSSADDLRAKEGKSVDAVFREVFRC